MTAVGGKTKTHHHNRLWLARKRLGLRQKQVAYLLNQHTLDQVSRYEKGLRVPSLETALKFEIIYRTPLRVLFADTYEHLQAELKQRMAENAGLPHISGTEHEGNADNEPAEICEYSELLDMPAVPLAELAPARQHAIRIIKRLAYK